MQAELFRRCRRPLLLIFLACALVLSALPVLAGGGHGGHGDSKPIDCKERSGFPEPCRIQVEENQDPAQIFVQFTEEEVVQYDANGSPTPLTIWTRSYGLEKGKGLIPGPSFFFTPGDFLQITLTNLLSPDRFAELENYENNVNPGFDTDEIIDHVGHEVNVPHNPNNTNLHTHGLHVDPTEDNVTLIILPEGQTKEGCPNYDYETCNDREKLQDPATLECCVAGPGYDQSLWDYIREGSWPYQYRIPGLHMPGTHWYHAHKHGSTSVHVENGMAGALIIQPDERQDRILPKMPDENDRVMVIQEIANYGQNKGKAKGLTDIDIDSAGASATADSTGGNNGPSPTLKTINGEVLPTLTLAKGQAERWRFINAAANHASFSYLWLGRKVSPKKVDGKKPASGTEYYQQVPMKLIAIDGITLEAAVEITAERPVFMGPGNRADVLVQIDDPGTYALIKNHPVTIVEPAKGGYGTGDWTTVKVPMAQDQISNPYLQPQTYPGTPNFNNDQHCWKYTAPLAINLESDPKTAVKESYIGASMVPILRVNEVEARDGSRLLDVHYDTKLEAGDQGWRPIAVNDLGGGATDDTLLFMIEVESTQANYSLPSDSELDARLKKLSPTGNPNAAPAYASLVSNHEILQSRTALFDISGAGAGIFEQDCDPSTDPAKCEQQTIRQFTLNGRQFDLSDSIGNPNGDGLLAEPLPTEPIGAEGVPQEGDVLIEIDPLEHHGMWKNQFWTNPAYYQDVQDLGAQKACYFPVRKADGSVKTIGGNRVYESKKVAASFDYDTASATTLDREAVTGIATPSVVNTSFPEYSRIAGIPGEPVATTAEEWIMINNTPVGHPFHIHINPFFITEVGQLSYEPFANGNGWVLRTINPDPNGQPANAKKYPAPTSPMKLPGTSDMWWVVNNWWDTIVIPPHGYVKMRYWMNVPQQDWDGQTITDNVNRYGNWVYHCHILRHEDRGMMMIVGTQPLVEKQAMCEAMQHQHHH